MISYNSNFPKHRFIEYISLNKDLVLHGSNTHNISTFETRKQTLYNGKYTEAVFASKDGIWSVFFAVLDRTKVKGSIRNGCLETKKGNKFYFFSLTRDSLVNDPWTKGMIYFFPKNSFYQVSKGHIRFDEWVSENPVKPIARLVVDPIDFYYIDKASIHNEEENIISTWIKYKWRSRYRNLVQIIRSEKF